MAPVLATSGGHTCKVLEQGATGYTLRALCEVLRHCMATEEYEVRDVTFQTVGDLCQKVGNDNAEQSQSQSLWERLPKRQRCTNTLAGGTPSETTVHK